MRVVWLHDISVKVSRDTGCRNRMVTSVLYGYIWFIHQVIRGGSFLRIGFGKIGYWTLNSFGKLIIDRYNIKMVDNERLLKWDKDLRIPVKKKK